PAWFEAHTRAEARAALRLIAEHNLRGVLLMPSQVEEMADEIRQAGVAVVVGPQKPQGAEPVARGLAGRGRAGLPGGVGGDGAEGGGGAAWLVNFGRPGPAARRGLTGQPVEALGLPEAAGRLQPGDAADFVVWDGDPVDSASRPAAVVAAGQRVAKGPDDESAPVGGRGPAAAPRPRGRGREQNSPGGAPKRQRVIAAAGLPAPAPPAPAHGGGG